MQVRSTSACTPKSRYAGAGTKRYFLTCAEASMETCTMPQHGTNVWACRGHGLLLLYSGTTRSRNTRRDDDAAAAAAAAMPTTRTAVKKAMGTPTPPPPRKGRDGSSKSLRRPRNSGLGITLPDAFIRYRFAKGDPAALPLRTGGRVSS